MLIAIWDGKPAALAGGTADVVEYHQFGDMTHLGEGPGGRRGLAQDDTDLVYHIVCSRDRPDGAPADGLQPGTARWLVAHPERIEIDDIPGSLDRMIRRTGEFNRDIARAGADASPVDVLPGWREALAGQPDLARTAEYFARADRLATRYAVRYRAALRALYALAALMGIAFIAYADLGRPSMIAAYLGLFVVGFVLYRIAAGLQWHRKFLDYRALAEGLRVQFYWRLAGVSGQLRNDFAYDNFPVREAYAHKVAEKELLKQYTFMLDIYRVAAFRLSRCRNVDEKRDLLRALGEAALDEHAEWILVHRERPLEPGKL